MSGRKFLCLGAGDGWHRQQLSLAATNLGCSFTFADYESLRAVIDSACECTIWCHDGDGVQRIEQFDAILTRTMPAGSLEKITFRLAILHAIESQLSGQVAVVNRPRALEIAIDKFATLAMVAQLGFPVPETITVQSRQDAMDAFRELGGDCVVKPVLGGEGRGVMRVRDDELAWSVFSTLQQLDAVCYVQRFVPPGGRDTRLLVVGESVQALRRTNANDFRTNVRQGGTSVQVQPAANQIAMAHKIVESIGLRFASVDILDCDDGIERVLEVNAIPGWKGAQDACHENIAENIVGLLCRECELLGEERC